MLTIIQVIKLEHLKLKYDRVLGLRKKYWKRMLDYGDDLADPSSINYYTYVVLNIRDIHIKKGFKYNLVEDAAHFIGYCIRFCKKYEFYGNDRILLRSLPSVRGFLNNISSSIYTDKNEIEKSFDKYNKLPLLYGRYKIHIESGYITKITIELHNYFRPGEHVRYGYYDGIIAHEICEKARSVTTLEIYNMAKAYIKNNELIYVRRWSVPQGQIMTVNKQLIDELEKK